jgi:hypothetical protein
MRCGALPSFGKNLLTDSTSIAKTANDLLASVNVTTVIKAAKARSDGYVSLPYREFCSVLSHRVHADLVVNRSSIGRSMKKCTAIPPPIAKMKKDATYVVSNIFT